MVYFKVKERAAILERPCLYSSGRQVRWIPPNEVGGNQQGTPGKGGVEGRQQEHNMAEGHHSMYCRYSIFLTVSDPVFLILGAALKGLLLL